MICKRCSLHAVPPGYTCCAACREDILLRRKQKIERVAKELGPPRHQRAAGSVLSLRSRDLPVVKVYLERRTTKRREERTWRNFKKVLANLNINQWYELRFEDAHTRDLAAMWITGSSNMYTRTRTRGCRSDSLFVQRLSDPWA